MGSIEIALESFREAAVSPDQWPQALESLASALRSDAANLVIAPTTARTVASSPNIEPIIREYFRSPISDPRERRVNPHPGDGFMPDQAYFSRREIASNPYYQEFLIPHGFGWNATASLDGRLMLGLRRGLRRGPYQGADLALLNCTLPRLQAASRIASISWISGFRGQLAAFERLGRGALLLNSQGRVITCNAGIKLGDGLDVVDGHLNAAGDPGRLRKFIESVLQPDDATPSSCILALPRPSGGRPWVLDGISCRTALRSLHSDAAALILVTDLEHSAPPDVARLQLLFQLTATEARVTREIGAGRSVREAAHHLNLSEEHVRQRLKSVFNKTETARQGELIVLLTRLGGSTPRSS